MANIVKRIFAILMVACMFTSVLPMQALAADVTETTETTTEGGITTTTNTITTTSTDETTGKVTVIVEVSKNYGGTAEDGSTVTGKESSTSTVVTQEGIVVAESKIVEGSETQTREEEITPENTGLPTVTVVLTPGEKATGTASGNTSSTEKESCADEYGKSVTTVTTTTDIDRTVTATATENETVVEVTGSSNMKPLIPDRSIDDDGDLTDEQLLPEYTYSGGFNDTEPVAAPEGGYDYRFTGFGQMSIYGAATENGGRTGALQFQLEYDPFFDPESDDNKVITDEDIFLAYCADIDTGGIDNFWYRLDSLEDSGYYDEESASYIRAIALNGYWGTGNTPDENGNYRLGSLRKLKEDMKAALSAGTLTGITAEEIDSLTEGQALNATQSAIWMHANETTNGTYVDTERLITKGYAADKSKRVEPSEQDRKNALAVFNYLMGLAPMEKPDHSEVIDEDAFIVEDSMSITVGDQVADAEANYDDDKTNDVYDVSLNFALVVTPDGSNDDMIVQVIGIDENGNPTLVAQGRTAGGDPEEDAQNNFNNVVYDAKSGIYTLENLTLAENSDFNFDLKLVGTQHLEHGVYIFNSEVRNGTSSQTFVSVLEGSKEVNVTKGYSICFNVDEEMQVTVETSWNSDYDPVEEVGVEPDVFRFNNNDDAEVIQDEEVPLASPAETGDNTLLWVVVIAAALLGLAAFNLRTVKRSRSKNESF